MKLILTERQENILKTLLTEADDRIKKVNKIIEKAFYLCYTFRHRESLSNERNNMSDDFMPILEGKFIGVSLDTPNKIVTTENIQHLDPHYLIYSYAMKNFVEVNPDQTLSKIEPTKIGRQDYPDKLILSLLKFHKAENNDSLEAKTYGFHLAQIPTLHLFALQLQAPMENVAGKKAYPDQQDNDKIHIFQGTTPDSKGVMEWATGIKEYEIEALNNPNTEGKKYDTVFLVNLGHDNIKRYKFNSNNFSVSYQGHASAQEWEEVSTKYIGIDKEKSSVIYSNDLNDFAQEAAIFDKKTGRLVNPEKDKEANIQKLRDSIEIIPSDSIYQEHYLSLLTASFRDHAYLELNSQTPVYNWTKRAVNGRFVHVREAVK